MAPRTRVSRLPDRGRYDRETIHAIVDEAPVCHVAFAVEGEPYCLPTLHARDGEDVLLHGSAGSRMLRHAAEGHPLSLCFTLLDGMVLARSAMHHSVNYRSAVLFGRGEAVRDEAERTRALHLLTDRLVPGRWAEVRPPDEREMKATLVVRVRVEGASAKVRSGGPKDDEADYALPVWAGVVPVTRGFGTPEPDPRVLPGAPLPAWVRSLGKGRA